MDRKAGGEYACELKKSKKGHVTLQGEPKEKMWAMKNRTLGGGEGSHGANVLKKTYASRTATRSR